MQQYTRIIHRNRFEVSVELPDGAIKSIPINEFSQWNMVIALSDFSTSKQKDEVIEVEDKQEKKDEKEVIQLDLFDEVEENISKNKEDVKKEVEVGQVSDPEEPKKKRGRKKKVDTEDKPNESKPVKNKKADYKAGSFRKNTNGLGVDHPYEMVNIYVESVEYTEGVYAPF